MKRRDFLSAGSAALAASTLPTTAPAQSTARAGASYPVGDFILARNGNGLQVTHRDAPGRILWDTAPDGDFLGADIASADIQDFGTPEGSFSITDTVTAAFGRPTIDAIDTIDAVTADGGPAAGTAAAIPAVTVSGRLAGAGRSIGYRLLFEAVSSTHLRFTITADTADVNRIRLNAGSAFDEALFGFGQQLTYFNQKGYLLPILVQEHGVGRGQPGITDIVDLLANRGGGTPFSTEAPAPHYLSSRLRSLFLENTEYSTFDMRQPDRIGIKVWSGVMNGRILYGRTPLDLIEAFSAYAGRMRALPDWIHEGLVLGTQGGTEAVRRKIDTANRAGIPLAAVWLQD